MTCGRTTAGGLFVLALALLVGGCRSATSVTVELTTDALCVDVIETSITTGHLAGLAERPATTTTGKCDETTGRIGDIVVVPSAAKDGEFAVRVVTGLTMTADECVAAGYRGGCIVARRALRFVPHENLELKVPMETSCIDVPCEATETCRSGKCYPAKLPEGCFDPLDCSEPIGGTGTGGEGTGEGGREVGGGTGGSSIGGTGGVATGGRGTAGETRGGLAGIATGSTRGGAGGIVTSGRGGSGGEATGGAGGVGGGGDRVSARLAVPKWGEQRPVGWAVPCSVGRVRPDPAVRRGTSVRRHVAERRDSA